MFSPMLANTPILLYAASLFFATRALKNDLASVTALCVVPVYATALAILSDIPRRIKLSKIYDSAGLAVRVWQKRLPFLPDASFESPKKYESIYRSLVEKQQTITKSSLVSAENASWALVTGASKGIGRAIAISLARRNIPIVLVARDVDKLQNLSRQIKECYGVQTLVVKCDIGCEKDVNALMETLLKSSIEIDILFNNAGIGETGQFVEMSGETMEQMFQVNLRGTTMLTQRFGVQMKKRRRGRVVIISSITGAMPGIPTSAMYAATKSYQRSMAGALGRELEGYGIGVTCAMPGAVSETNFASNANMEDSAIFKFPVGGLTPQVVAENAVNAMIAGRQEVFIGWMYVIMGNFMSYFLPNRLLMLICEFTFKPLDFREIFSRQKVERKNH